MNFDPIEQMSVYLNLEGSDKKRGTLAGSGKERRTHFEYSPDFLAAPLLISPFYVKVATGLASQPRDPVDGLGGLFNDSLPDG
jgi:serine/threonine-protein kinase HipA